MVQRRAPQKVPVPQWHPKWELGVVLSGHLGWVRSISFDPSNQWFATGSMDRTIKIWDFPKSVLGDKDCLKLTLTGHISGVRGLAVSDRHPYLFSGNDYAEINQKDSNRLKKHSNSPSLHWCRGKKSLFECFFSNI